MPSKRKKNEARKAKKEGRRESEISKFCFLRMPELRKLIFCIWITERESIHMNLLFHRNWFEIYETEEGFMEFRETNDTMHSL